MKKIIITTALTFVALFANAQAKMFSSGKMAFGSTSTTPNYNIDVITGDVNVNTLTNGYRLNGNYILWQNNVSSCIFAGTSAGYSNTAVNNSGFGYKALFTNSTGTPVSAFGYKALFSNTTGTFNDAFGDSALYTNSYGAANAAFGSWALTGNTTGNDNVSIGGKSMVSNTDGSANTAVGWAALNKNIHGSNNTAIGYEALYNATYSTSANNNNTAVGYYAGNGVTSGSNNTFLGYSASISNGTFTNATAIGYNSWVTASNMVVVGNGNITSSWVQVDWSTGSDSRIKKNIKENIPGLAFIKKLRPVSYNMDMDQLASIQGLPDSMRTKSAEALKAQVVYSGLIAQEVETAAQKVGYDFSGIDKPADNNGLHGLRYATFVVPIIKAVQELSKSADSLTTVNHKQDSVIKALQNQINQIVTNCCPKTGGRTMNPNGSGEGKNANGGSITPTETGAMLYQNVPNPFNQTTIIKCIVPDASKAASLLVFDMNGTLKKTIQINGKGEVNVTINAKELIAGMYFYSLIIDGNEIDTKKMILTE